MGLGSVFGQLGTEYSGEIETLKYIFIFDQQHNSRNNSELYYLVLDVYRKNMA